MSSIDNNNEYKEALKNKHLIGRRSILKGISLLPFALNDSFAKEVKTNTSSQAHVHMFGDLDDDLIIIKADQEKWDIMDCYQMHNPVKFYLEGRIFDNELCPGYIEYDKKYNLTKDEILVISLANEREEREPYKKLLDRTHYKSVPLYVNSKKVIPSMIPEKGDIDYSTWFDPKSEEAVYNYYRLWENAVVNLAIVVPYSGLYQIDLLTKVGSISASSKVHVNAHHASNVKFANSVAGAIQNHPLAEIDGGVWNLKGYRAPNDDKVRELAAYHIYIKNIETQQTIISPLPYPFPYINRIFFIACSEHDFTKEIL